MLVVQTRGTIVLQVLHQDNDFPIRGYCKVRRSSDNRTITLQYGENKKRKELVIPAIDVLKIELVPRSHLVVKQHSELGGAIVGDLVAGPAGALIGAIAAGGTTKKKVYDDIAVWTIRRESQVMQVYFVSPFKDKPKRWYPKAKKILAPWPPMD